jgi:hypothetical protein
MLGLCFLSLRSRLLLFLLSRFGLAGLKELFLLLPPQFFIFSGFNAFLNCFGPLIIEISPHFLDVLSDDVRLIELVLDALTLSLFDPSTDVFHAVVEVDPRYNINFVEMVDSANDHVVCISLEVKKGLQFIFELIVASTQPIDLELLADYLLN